MEISYNDWHKCHNSDDDITAPWHSFVKNNLTTNDLSMKSVLEIGCGRGGFSNYLAQRINPPQIITACDYSISALDIAKAKYGTDDGRITWQQENIMALSFEDNSFRTIVSCETIEHVSDPHKAILELYRVLKPGGRLFLTCPNYFNPFGIWCFYRWLIGKPFTEGGQPYVNYILFPRIYFWIIKCGFEIQTFKSSEIIIPAKVPKHLWNDNTPFLLKPFGYRTYYILRKKAN